MRVSLVPPAWAIHWISDLTDWQRRPLPVARMRPFDLPDDAYFEYAYLDASGQPRPDPDNPNPSANPWWPYARSLLGPRYRPHPLAEVGNARPRGQLLRLQWTSSVLTGRRRVTIYTPAGHATDALPIVLFQDGKAYQHWGKAPQILDRLVSAGACRPAHLVLSTPGDRTRDYAFNPAFRRFVCEELLPRVETRIRGTGQRIALGASLGGLASALLVWHHPDLFGTVCAQSGAFLLGTVPGGLDPYHGPEWLTEQVSTAPGPRNVRWYLDCGTLEWLHGPNRRLAEALRRKGYEVVFQERAAGHNWVNWRNGLPEALRYALGS
jgi:enterochelin esterase family protein